MRRMILPLMLLVAVACQPAAVGLSDDDVAAINDFIAAYNQAAVDGDWDAWSQLWTDDVVYMLPNAPAVEGRTSLREMASEFPPHKDLSVTADEIDGRADLAFVRGRFSLTWPAEADAEPFADEGKFLMILRKTPDGIWQAAIECYNSDLSLPSMEGEHVEGEEQT
jgi:ketosteroid isomerase-like protein